RDRADRGHGSHPAGRAGGHGPEPRSRLSHRRQTVDRSWVCTPRFDAAPPDARRLVHRTIRMHILVLNVGSSSLKFQLIDTDGTAIAESHDRRLARGQIERVGGEAIVTLEAADRAATTTTAQLRDHAAAVEHIIAWLTSADSGVPISRVGEIEAVGHRVVHGGERFSQSIRVDDDVWKGLEALVELAPLHNPHNLRGIAAARTALGSGVPQVAVFDTAFHHGLPE